MTTALAAALLALGIAQQTGASPQSSDDRPPSTGEGVDSTTAARPFWPSEEVVVPAGIPFVPSVGPARRPSDGVHLDLGIVSELRARTLATADAGTTWGTDVEVTPGVALEVGSPSFTLALGYAPRLTVPFNVGSYQLAVLNRATARVEWQADSRWTLTGLGVFVVGDYSQLVPASTPGGSGPPPPVLNPVRSFQTYPYVGIDTLVRIDGLLSRRTRLRLAGGYFDVGGTGPVGEANQPRAWGPQGEGSFAWEASRAATLTTEAAVQSWIMSGNEYFALATFTESWRQAWSSSFDSTLGIGGGIANRDVESRTAAGRLVPVGRLTLDFHPESRRPIRLTLDAGLAPYFDTYSRVPYQRFTFGGTFAWTPADTWQVGASLSGAVAPYTVRAPESYGTAGVSASYAPVPFLILTAGGFVQSQLQGGDTALGGFQQWSGYFSLTFRDRFAL